ncbi:DUF3696 domain-containing protein [Enterobacter kobei]|uniref:DUF3696 domain-containing protein n=1 Tax=Enterobacter kobei TaxID=208224 RepID=UPI0020052B51|nr:DUF3696 domain-containing protein [Enterobacter kobei]MCK7349919.1 DUF3696 domain-containing protein [Enterobacter kobei]
MINKLALEYFKCFENIQIDLKYLNILSGENASGKSSLIQSILVLNQTMHLNEWSKKLILNGSNINLGTVSDVIDKVNGRNLIKIKFSDDENAVSWTFSGERSQLSMQIDNVQIDSKIIESPSILQDLLPPEFNDSNIVSTLRDMTYIKAERCGPRDFYTLIDNEEKKTTVDGEHSIALLFNNLDSDVSQDLVLNTAPPTLFQQVQARMREFFPGFEYKIESLEKINAVTLGIRTSEDTNFHRPMNVGFGLTQILPIIISCLTAKEGDLLIIENPEVHLHPKGQAMMGEFLAEVANTGVQIIIETHSDHVLNGIRRSVKSKGIDESKVAFYFFNNRAFNESQIISPQIDENGRIDHWPNGFFDQFDKDISFLAGWDL